MARSTAGITVKYVPETVAGTRPTTGTTTEIIGITDIPSIDLKRSDLECTELKETIAKQYTRGLADPGGAIGMTANHDDTNNAVWDAFVTAAEALTGGKQMWIEIYYPDETDAFWMRGLPQARGFGGASPDSVAETTYYFTPSQVVGYAAKLA